MSQFASRSMKDKGNDLEAQIERFFASNDYETTRNVSLVGRSGGRHEIDVLAKKSDGITDFSVMVECKAWNHPIEKDIVSKVMVGRYGVDVTALDEVGVKALRHATANCDVIVIDEVGKMEVESDGFVAAVKEALDAEKPLLLTLHKKSRNPLLQDIRRRDDIRILEVTQVNRNLLPYKIVKILKGEKL